MRVHDVPEGQGQALQLSDGWARLLEMGDVGAFVLGQGGVVAQQEPGRLASRVGVHGWRR